MVCLRHILGLKQTLIQPGEETQKCDLESNGNVDVNDFWPTSNRRHLIGF